MFNFTPDQQMALEFPGNVIVSAGAGSGKTRVLVEKYVRLLVDEHPEWSVDTVVAITFTRKAAAELKSRIIKQVLDEIQKEADGPRRARLFQLRNDVGAAPIGTIHTFCGRILREFSFDAHLNPDFTIVEGAQEGALRLKAAREAIALATAEKGGALYYDLLALLNTLSATRLNGILSGMLAGRNSYAAPARNYVSHSVDELFNNLKEFHRDYVTELRRELGGQWIAILRQLDQVAQPGKLKDVVGAAVEGWPVDPVTEWYVCEEILQTVMSGLMTQKGTCRVSEFKKAGLEDYDPIRPALEELCKKTTKARLGDLGEVDRADLQLSRHLAGLFLKTQEIYEELRGGGDEDGEAQLLDYADLELLAEKLVTGNSGIRRQIRERYRFLIIDEFQDTSQSQWNIVQPLVSGENGKLRQSCLFVVGDRKQGVYGFRDANVGLFNQVQDLVTASNVEWMGCDGKVSMAANFRTLEKPLSFINQVFKKLLTTNGAAYGVEFEPLELMKSSDEGCVEYLLAGSGEPCIDEETGKPVKKNIDVRREEESKLVAAHVAALLENGEAAPGQIALLFRKRSVFSIYEAALVERGVPVVTQQGFNLFHQPELADMVAAMNAVVYPHKDLVLVHYLRSPLVGFSDDLLLKIARCQGRTYWDKACRALSEKQYRLDSRLLPLSEREVERLSFALEVLQEARSLVGMEQPYRIVRTLMDRLGVKTIVQAGYRGEQALANLEKLLMLARSAEFLRFEEFLEYVESEGESDNGTAEAIDLTSSDAVKIMTIHAAKGLEFPVVYLPDLNSGTSNAPRLLNGDGREWMTMRLPSDIMIEPSFLMDYFKNLDEQKAEAEERRVFYVAMTRCEKRLVLSASCENQKSQNTFYSWIEDEFNRGKIDGNLRTEDDFEEYNPRETRAESSATVASLSREARIEAALRASAVIGGGQPNACKTIPAEPDAVGDTIYDLLPELLPVLYRGGVDEALRELEDSIALTLDDIQRQSLLALVRLLYQWILENFGLFQPVRFFEKLRVNYAAGIEVFQPHVMAGKRCGWVITPGLMGEAVAQEVHRYRKLVATVENAPEITVLNFAELETVEPTRS